MTTRRLAYALALGALIFAGVTHWRAQRTQSETVADEKRLRDAIAAEDRQHRAATRELAAARQELETRTRENAVRLAAATPPPASSVSMSPAKNNPAANLELRALTVRAFVSDQRLRYAALLQRVGFDGAKLQAFDRIVGDCQAVYYDPAQGRDARTQARQARDTQLQALFGADYDQWLEAERNEPARHIVAMLVQQAFSGGGAFTLAQMEALTRIAAEQRTPPQNGAPERYEWDAFLAGARAWVTPAQHQALTDAIAYRRANDRMNALAKKS